MSSDACDDFGFPTATLSRRQERRIRIRKYTSNNHWTSKYASLRVALEARSTLEFKNLVLEHGIHPPYRAAVWHAAASDLRGADTPVYDDLLLRAGELPVDVARQIELDLPRTFVEQRDFAAATKLAAHVFDGSRSAIAAAADAIANDSSLLQRGHGGILDALRRMLRAFVLAHPDIGYLQSMNFVAGFVLLVCGVSEETRAYDVFDALCAHMLRGYYTPDMLALQRDCAVVQAVARERMPALWAHLDRVGVAEIASLFLPRWLLCVYLNCFPADITCRVWDALFTAGMEAPRVLLEVALSVLCMCEEDLLGAPTFPDAAEVLKTINVRISDSSELMLLTQYAQCSMQSKSITEWRCEAVSTAPVGSPPRVRSAQAVVAPPVCTPTPHVPDALGRTPPVCIDGALDRLFSPLPSSPSQARPRFVSPRDRKLVSPLARVLRANGAEHSPRTPGPRTEDGPGSATSATSVASLRPAGKRTVQKVATPAAHLSAASPGDGDVACVDSASYAMHCAGPACADIGSALNASTAAALQSAQKRRVRRGPRPSTTPMKSTSAASGPGVAAAGMKRTWGFAASPASATLGTAPATLTSGTGTPARLRYATAYAEFDEDACGHAVDDVTLMEVMASAKKPRMDAPAVRAVELPLSSHGDESDSDTEQDSVAPLRASSVRLPTSARKSASTDAHGAPSTPRTLQMMLMSPRRVMAPSSAGTRDKGIALGVSGPAAPRAGLPLSSARGAAAATGL